MDVDDNLFLSIRFPSHSYIIIFIICIIYHITSHHVISIHTYLFIYEDGLLQGRQACIRRMIPVKRHGQTGRCGLSGLTQLTAHVADYDKGEIR